MMKKVGVKFFKIKRAFWTNHRWFSLGLHVDFDKKYADLHLGKHVLTVGDNRYPSNLPPEVMKELNCYWKEYCEKCNSLAKKCSMGCHPNKDLNEGERIKQHG